MIKYISKKSSLWCKFISLIFPDFQYYWTTIGQTIYYPAHVKDLKSLQYRTTLEHECIHVNQYKKCGKILFLFLYLFFPVPIFFAYFRWKFEREAYLVEINEDIDIDYIVETLYCGYLFPWPKGSMKKWFEKQKKKQN